MAESPRETEERFRMLLELAPDALMVHQAGRLVYVNAAAVSFFGARGPEELLGRPALALVHPDEHASVQERARRVLTLGGTVERKERRLLRLDGQVVLGETAVGRVNWKGQPAVQVIVRDITDRKRMEQALQLAKEQLTQANQQLEATVQARTAELSRALAELQQFSHAIIHDLRAPLRAVHSFVGLMKQGCTECHTPRSLEFMDQVQVAIGRMDDLITDALSYGRVMQQNMPLHPVNLNALIRDLIQSYPHLQPSEADIYVEGPLPLVLGNTAGLVQCFSNLLSNAVKFVAPGTRPRVRLWSQPRQQYQRIWVEDNGIGIPPEHQPQLFRMFCRLHPGHYPGTGIGLAVVHKVVERMGGRVGVESAAGTGSRFWVELKPVPPSKTAAPSRIAAALSAGGLDEPP